MSEVPANNATDERDIKIREMWPVVAKVLDEHGPASQAIDSFDVFATRDIMQINADMIPIRVKCTNPNSVLWKNTTHTITLGEHSLGYPQFTEGGKQLPLLNKGFSLNTGKNSRSSMNVMREIFPKECRLRELTYAAPLYTDIHHVVTRENEDGSVSTEEHVVKSMLRGMLPIPVRSRFCQVTKGLREGKTLEEMGEDCYDSGGYFIINGSEKFLISQLPMRTNFPFIFATPEKIHCEIRSCNERSHLVVNANNIRFKSHTKGISTLRIDIPFVSSQNIPVVVLLKALGVKTDRAIAQLIVQDMSDCQMLELIKHSLHTAVSVNTRQQALAMFVMRTSQTSSSSTMVDPVVNSSLVLSDKSNAAFRMLANDFLPHVGTGESSMMMKARFIGYCCHKMLQVYLKRRKPDNKDSYANKRASDTGTLMAGLYAHINRKMRKDAETRLQTLVHEGAKISFDSLFDNKQLTSAFRFSITSGNWVAGKSAGAKQDVSSILSRLSLSASQSQLNRINTPVGREGKMTKARELHNTHVGITCPSETPETISVGLVNNTSMVCFISSGDDPTLLKRIVMRDKYFVPYDDNITTEILERGYKIFVSGALIGYVMDGHEFKQRLRKMRLCLDIGYEVGIAIRYDLREVVISTDRGRFLHPLIPVFDGKLKISKDRLAQITNGSIPNETMKSMLAKGELEMIDAEEMLTLLVAVEPSEITKLARGDTDISIQYTHCELHPAVLYGHAMSSSPFANNNPPTRNAYQCGMIKQSIGPKLPSSHMRMDTMGHHLWYPQKPLVSTETSKHTFYQEIGSGQNPIVAIASYGGYNQEDSLIFNRASVERGLFHSQYEKSYTDQEKSIGNLITEHIGLPDFSVTSGIKNADLFSHLDEDGLPAKGCNIEHGRVIISKYKQINTSLSSSSTSSGITEAADANSRRQAAQFSDCSVYNRTNETGYVEDVILSSNGDGCRLVKVKLRFRRKPEIGDKFSSRHGQKGVIGMVYAPEDMLFNNQGISPDVIMNPHAIPSRMTVGHVLEMAMGTFAAAVGAIQDGTPFQYDPYETIQANMSKLGYYFAGSECMRNGMTGNMLEVDIFMGVPYYQKLKHLVIDKIHSRTTGPVDMLTRQPVEGRSRDGGLRFGEMERDCTIAHGAANLLFSRLLINSDGYTMYVCTTCGSVGHCKDSVFNCTVCTKADRHSSNQQGIVTTAPYAFKLLLQELTSMGIRVKLEPSQN